MTEKGWITLHRKIEDNWIWLDKEPFDKRSAWIDLILKANHKNKKFLYNGKLIEVERGSRITSMKKLSEEWGWSRKKVKNFLELLQSDNMIVYSSTSKNTTYTIVNYNDYQDKESDKGTSNAHQKNIKRTSNAHQRNTNNNDNNDNNDKQDIRSTQFDYVISEWNSLDKNISNIQTINSGTTRYKLLKARENEYGKDNIVKAIRNINNSSFLKGYEKSWKITFDWFIKPNNFIKVLEDNYNDSKNNKSNNLYSKDDRTDEAERQAFIERKLQQKIPINYKNRR